MHREFPCAFLLKNNFIKTKDMLIIFYINKEIYIFLIDAIHLLQ